MDLTVDEFIEGLLSDEAYDRPSDKVSPEELQLKLPEWFDEKKYNQGRRFHQDFLFGFSYNNMLGLVAIFAVPTILEVLKGSRRSNSPYTAYRRYTSTFGHSNIWLEYELKPGTLSWQSLSMVRSRHIRAGRAAKLKNQGHISQRDMALTLFASMGFAFLKPDKFSIRPLQEGDWEAYNHLVRVIGYMIGLQDRYNICRNTFEETRQVCRKMVDRFFTPCLENVPEYFEYMTRVMVDGMWSVNTALEATSLIYWTKYMADVPGYIWTENDRRVLYNKLKEHVDKNPNNIGVSTMELIEKCGVQGLPEKGSRILLLNDFHAIETAPAYKNLPFVAKYKLALSSIMFAIYSTYIGRILINLHMKWGLFLAKYFPYIAMWRFGITNAFVNIFKEDPTDDTIPIPNSVYYKPQPPEPWYKKLYAIIFW